MSFKAKLIIGDKEFNVLNFEYEISQNTDRNGVPRERVFGNLMELTIEASGKNQEITEWATDHTMQKDGDVVFFRSDAEASGKKITFKKGYCVYHKDVFDASGAVPMKTVIRLSVMHVEIDGSFSVSSAGFDIKKAAVKFGKAAATVAAGYAMNAIKTESMNAAYGSDQELKDDPGDSEEVKAEKKRKREEKERTGQYAAGGFDGAGKMGDSAISSFIPD